MQAPGFCLTGESVGLEWLVFERASAFFAGASDMLARSKNKFRKLVEHVRSRQQPTNPGNS